mgnify:CR=1 FL=1
MGSKKHPEYIVAIGASAGGLEALSNLFSNLHPPLENAVFIVAQHVGTEHKSMLVELLGRSSQMDIKQAENNTKMEGGIVYVTPSGYDVTISGGTIFLEASESGVTPRPSIDRLFESVGKVEESMNIAIILSGTGSDGSRGIEKMKNHGGLVFVQEPSTAKYDGMPNAAIHTGLADHILPAKEIAETLTSLISGVVPIEALEGGRQGSLESAEPIDQLYNRLTAASGTDFSNYKSSTIYRRLDKRMNEVGVESLEDYIDFLDDHEGEVNQLIQTILIGYTSFFRDPEVYEVLEEHLQRLIYEKNAGDAIRIWVPGCASGEEPYTIAILLKQLLGKNINRYNIQIFGTDIDENSIRKARKGIYGSQALENTPQDVLNHFFEKTDDGNYRVIKEVRDLVLFSSHDITNHPPFLRLDIISCRNLLIYFGSELQRNIIPLFHYALNPGGLLLLGKSETIRNFSELFSTVNGTLKLYKSKTTTGKTKFKLGNFQTASFQDTSRNTKLNREREKTLIEQVRDVLYKRFEHPFIVIDSDFNLVETKGEIAPYVGISSGMINSNIFKMINEELSVELRTVLSKADKEKEDTQSHIKKFNYYGNEFLIRLKAKPFYDHKTGQFHYIVIFEQQDVDQELLVYSSSDNEGEIGSEDFRIKELEQELSATKEHLQTYIEELEASNEELQSLNEELQSANEELQSANEELETSNEELQSTNEEMQIAYSELQEAKDDIEKKEEKLRISEANMSALLENTLQGFILIDSSFNVISKNSEADHLADKIFGRAIESGNSVFSFIPEEHLQKFRKDLNQVFNGKVVNGQWLDIPHEESFLSFTYSLTPVRSGKEVEAASVGILDITERENVKKELAENEELMKSIFNIADVGICVTDHTGRFVKVNEGYCNIYGYEEEELIGEHFTKVVAPEEREQLARMHDDFIAGKEEIPDEFKVQRKNGQIIDVHVTASLLDREDHKNFKVTTVRDVTERKRSRNLLEQTQQAVKVGGWEYDVIRNELTWTDEIYEIFEVDDEFELNTENAISLYQGEHQAVIRGAFYKAINDGEPYDLELMINTARDHYRWVRTTCKPIRIHGKTIKLFGTLQDITARKKADEEIKKLSRVASRTQNGVVIMDASRRIDWVNNGFEMITGSKLEAVRGADITKVLSEYYSESNQVDQLVKNLEQKENFSMELVISDNADNKVWLKLNGTTIFNDEGEPASQILILTDVTELKEAQQKLRKNVEEKEVMLNEIHHRVKNNLAVITSLLDLHADNIEDEEVRALLYDSETRIRSIAMVHEKLYRSDTFADIRFDEYLMDFLANINRSYPGPVSDIEYEFSMEEVRLTMTQAIPCGLIINELVTNAYKHAFEGVEDENKIIYLTLKEEDDEIELVFADNGRGWPEEFDFEGSSTLGLSLIKSLVDQLRGDMNIWNEGGACFSLSFERG